MLSFSDFVQSRKAAVGAAEQMHRSRSAGHGSSHPLLQQLDELKQLRRTNTSNSSQKPGQLVTEALASYTNETDYSGTENVPCRTIQQPMESVAAKAATNALGCAAIGHLQQQLSSTSSNRIQQPQDQLLSRSESRRLVQQHTTTTISSIANSAASSHTVSRSQSLKQLSECRQATVSPGLAHRAARAVGTAIQLPNSPANGSRLLQPLSIADALPSPKSSRSLVSISMANTAAAVRGSYTSPPTPLGRPYAGRIDHVQRHPAATAAVSHKHNTPAVLQQHLVSKQTSSLSVVSSRSHSNTTVDQQDTRQHFCQQDPAGLQATSDKKFAAIRALQQQQQLLQQTLQSYSLKRAQQQLVQASGQQPQEQSGASNNTASGGCTDGITNSVAVPDDPAEASTPTKSNTQIKQQPDSTATEIIEGKMEISLNGDLTPRNCRHPATHRPVTAVDGAATGAGLGLIANEPSESSPIGALLSPETTKSSQHYFSTPVDKVTMTQHQAVEGPLSSTSSDLSDEPACTASDASTASDNDRYSKPLQQEADTYSTADLGRLRSSRPSSPHCRLGKSLEQPCMHGSLGMVTVAGTAKQPMQDRLDDDLVRCSDSHILKAARRHAQQLQQQNDALVRVLERERQQQEKTRQQVCDACLELKECRAEWEVALQVLRQDKAALTAQLRRALARSDHQEVLDAYDTALAAAALKVEEAQQAAAALAAQLTDTELQLNQLQHLCNQGTLSCAKCAHEDGVNDSSSLDSAAVAIAVAAAGRRAGANGKPPAALGAESNCTRGLRALRQHQKHLEQQVIQQQQEHSKLQRDNIKLIRYERQYTSAVNKLQAATAGQEAAAAVAEEAGLRAAAANGRAERLQQQLEQLIQENQQLKLSEQQVKQQLLDLQQSQQELSMTAAQQQASPTKQGLAGVQLPVHQHKLVEAAVCEQVPDAAMLQQGKPPPGPVGPVGPAAQAKGAPAISAPASAADSPAVQRSRSMSAMTPAVKQQRKLAGNDKTPGRGLRHSMSAPSRPGADASGTKAMALAQQVAKVLPVECPEQQQLASLMSAIASGIQERKALTEQGQILLGMVMGTAV